MQAIIFVGIQATGKSTFFKQMFADTHVRINGDMLGNKGLEQELIDACIKHQQPYVVDKMNFTKRHRAPYLERAKAAWFKRIGYYFSSRLYLAVQRNQNEDRREKDLPEIAIVNAHSNLEIPSYGEGFDELYYVSIVGIREDDNGLSVPTFEVEPWLDI